MIHKLEIENNYLQNLLSGVKKAEVRFNDRDYQVNDILEFWDYSDLHPKCSQFRVTHIHGGLGVERNYVILSVEKIKEEL